MTDSPPSLLGRLALGISTLFALLSDRNLAQEVQRLRQSRGAAPVPAPVPAPQPIQPSAPIVLKEASPEAALQLLGILQREARFLDFIEEDIAAYSDADIGSAARLVHDGCHKALHEYFSIQPTRDEAEGSSITINAGFDATTVRLTGNVVGQPPFRGHLSHRGWRVTDIRLPRMTPGHDAHILAAAEVEL